MSSGPAARWMAPSTPPPPARDWLAALTIASTARLVMSARSSRIRPAPARSSGVSAPIDACESEARVVAPEAVRGAEREVDAFLAAHIGHVVEVALGIGLVEIDRGRKKLVTDRQDGEDGFHRTRGAQQVTVHR